MRICFNCSKSSPIEFLILSASYYSVGPNN
jgi:hypothetical protein